MMIFKLKLKRRSISFANDASGVAAIEFALIVPVMMFLMLGAVEYSRAVVMGRRFHQVAATIGDLVARDSQFTTSTSVPGLTHLAETMWYPYDKSSLVLQVLNVRKSSTTTTKMAKSTDYVDWSQSLKVDGSTAPATTYTSCQIYAGLPTAMITAGNSTIIVKASYTFHTLLHVPVPGMSSQIMAWTSMSSHTPRNTCVGLDTTICTPTCE